MGGESCGNNSKGEETNLIDEAIEIAIAHDETRKVEG